MRALGGRGEQLHRVRDRRRIAVRAMQAIRVQAANALEDSFQQTTIAQLSQRGAEIAAADGRMASAVEPITIHDGKRGVRT
jgi:hypothetical protein